MATDFDRLLEWIDENMNIDKALSISAKELNDPTEIIYAAFQQKIDSERIRLSGKGREGQLDAFELFVKNQRYSKTSIGEKIEQATTRIEREVVNESEELQQELGLDAPNWLDEDDKTALTKKLSKRAKRKHPTLSEEAIEGVIEEETKRISRMNEFVTDEVQEVINELKERAEEVERNNEVLIAGGRQPKKVFEVPDIDEISPSDLPADTPKRLKETIKNYAHYKRTGKFGSIRDVTE